MATSFQQFERLAEVCGAESALRLCSFAGGAGPRRLYVPVDADSPHILRRVMGSRGFARLVQAHGGENIAVPVLDTNGLRTAGKVHALLRAGLSRQAIANAIGITPQRVNQLVIEFRDFSDEGLDHDDE